MYGSVCHVDYVDVSIALPFGVHVVGERCKGNKKFPTHTQDLSMVMSIYERESESTYPCRSLSGSVKKRG